MTCQIQNLSDLQSMAQLEEAFDWKSVPFARGTFAQVFEAKPNFKRVSWMLTGANNGHPASSYALKIPLYEWHLCSKTRKLFAKEAGLLQFLQEQNFESSPRLYATSIDEALDGPPYMLMELIEGIDLQKFNKKLILPFEWIEWLSNSLARIISQLHALNVLHMDIKPENLIIDSVKERGGKKVGHRLRLIDFGLSKRLQFDLESKKPMAENSFNGSLGYMAPEIIRGQPYTYAPDIWSLGMTLLNIALGRFAFNLRIKNFLAFMKSLDEENIKAILRIARRDLLKRYPGQAIRVASFLGFIQKLLILDQEERVASFGDCLTKDHAIKRA